MEAEAVRGAKRQLKREQQREFRRKVNEQLDLLRARAKELEFELHTKRKNRSLLLPWSQVAQALQSDLVECQAANRHLVKHAEEMQMLNQLILKWLRSIYPSVQHTPSQYPAWYRVGLCQDDTSRRAICEWVTQHMYHHTDHVLRLAGFHPSDQNASQAFDITTSKGYMEYVYQDRCIHYASLDIVLEAYRELFHADSPTSVFSHRQRLDPTILGREYIYSRGHAFNESLIHREFVSDNRIVFVQHSIHDDVRFPLASVHRHKANWIVLEVLSPNVIMETKVFQKSQLWTAEGGYYTFEEEASQISDCEYHLGQLKRKERPAEDILKEHSAKTFPAFMTLLNNEVQIAIQRRSRRITAK